MEIVAIFGVPRSGTSWLGQIFNSHPNVAYRFQPLFSYAFKGRINLDSDTKDIRRFNEDLLETDDDFVLQRTNTSGQENNTNFDKGDVTHLVWKEVRYINLLSTLLNRSNTKLVLIVRHPCAVINSWFKAPKEFNKDWELVNEWRFAEKKNTNLIENFYGFNKWKKATSDFLILKEQFPERVELITYEKLNQTPEETIKRLFTFCGLKYVNQTEIFLNKSRSTDSDDPYGVYRKEQDSYKWKNSLPREIIEEIEQDLDFLKYKNIFGWK